MIDVYFGIHLYERRFLDQIQSTADIKDSESPTVPKPPRRDLDNTNSTTNKRKVIPVDFDLKVDYNSSFLVSSFRILFT